MRADLPRLALSIRQPWAYGVAIGWKPVENRSWRGSEIRQGDGIADGLFVALDQRSKVEVRALRRADRRLDISHKTDQLRLILRADYSASDREPFTRTVRVNW